MGPYGGLSLRGGQQAALPLIGTWRQKTRVPGLSCGVVCVTLRLAVLVKHRLVTDGRTQAHG